MPHPVNDRDARERMVAEQLVPRGIRDERVLDAMRRVPREPFVPEASRAFSYADRALPIGSAQTISQPYMVAVMTEAIALTPTARALEVGTGSGYQAAILGELAREVITMERWPELAEAARLTLLSLGYQNIRVIVGDGSLGYPAGAPFDAILVAAGAPRIPDALTQQLSPDGGRLVIPIGAPDLQRLTIVTRQGERLTETVREQCVFVPLLGDEGWRP